jgi:hypothetical protein
VNHWLPFGRHGDIFYHYLKRSVLPAIHHLVAHARIMTAIPSLKGGSPGGDRFIEMLTA